jgi:hypothetical protein
MRGGVLWHHGGTAFYACDDAVLLRVDEMPGENVGLGWRGHVHRSTDLPGCGFVGSWGGIVSPGSGCLYGLGTALPIVCPRCPLSLSLPMPAPIPRPIPTSPNPKTLLPPLPATAAIPALVRFQCTLHTAPGLLCGVGPRVGTSKPTSPLRRRRHRLATPRVLDIKKYADRLPAAPGPFCASLGPSGRVSSKGSRSEDHGRGPPALG